MNFYWNLILWDGETIKVKPENAELVQNKLSSGEGFIKTKTRSIAVKGVKDFVESSERFIDQKLLEGSAQAFDYAVLNPDGSVVYRWVKKSVTRREYTKYYAPTPAYKKIGENSNYVIVSWKQPVHLIDNQRMEELTQDEELRLAKRV